MKERMKRTMEREREQFKLELINVSVWIIRCLFESLLETGRIFFPESVWNSRERSPTKQSNCTFGQRLIRIPIINTNWNLILFPFPIAISFLCLSDEYWRVRIEFIIWSIQILSFFSILISFDEYFNWEWNSFEKGFPFVVPNTEYCRSWVL